MSVKFLHIGRFRVTPEHRLRFIDVMRDYEAFATQNGLDHSHLVEDEADAGTFLHITAWQTREDWVEIEQSDGHKNMHAARNALLAEPMQHDFVSGAILD
ncbi:MAG: antibiotic biosynthesis monooxygenase family protein [Pseudomonadota bacterium]